jgi:hypothetical protein
VIFVDKLSLKSCLHVWQFFRKLDNPQQEKAINVLDGFPKNIKTSLLINGLWFFGIKVQETEFYAGHLRTKDGENVWTAAQNKLSSISFEAAQRCLAESKDFNALNKKWGRNTVMLFLAKYFFRITDYSGECTVFKILIAEALSQKKKGIHHLILGIPSGFPANIVENVSCVLHIDTYSLRGKGIRQTRLSVFLLIAFVWVKRLENRLLSLFQTREVCGDASTNTFLLIQEDNISKDRSYRSQLHWLFKDDPPPDFRTLILETNPKLYHKPDSDLSDIYKIFSVTKDMLYGYTENNAVQKSINSALRMLLYKSLFGRGTPVNISFQLAFLFIKANLLASFCKEQNVKLFMTCENYYVEADAMNLISTSMDIHTLSYQYSNMSSVGPAMMTTAETMFMFSGMFHERWENNWIKPINYVDTGYLFDYSFNLVKARATKHKKRLLANGAKFIINYLDESVQSNSNKYGMVSENDHYDEIISLAKLVLDRGDTAVITKSQFMSSSPSVMFAGDEILNKAIRTGRFLEMHHGKHRNIILPAETAMASSIVIGHAVGATAGLEAALTGSKCVLLNPYQMQGDNIEIFKDADILYDNINEALDAISCYRQGKTAYKKLGSWDTIIDKFDPFRDGRSAQRMCEYIEKTITTE